MNEKLESLPPISEMMRAAGLEPKKSLGQNFLFDLNITRKIARSVPGIDDASVLEVGPGPGGLTRALLECGAKRVVAIEKDPATKPILDQIVAASDGRLSVIYGDALKVPTMERGEWSICANLPYNVGTELLINWLHRLDKINSLTLMFQKEVAERIVAKPGTKAYGRLSVLAQLTAAPRILFNVPNTAFTPPPKVQSAVIQLMPRPAAVLPTGLETLTARLFGQRRKMIRAILPDIDWSQFNLTGTERAEQLSPEKFAEIAIAVPDLR
ncbi:MAG: 16S rRNA (adenine(1518)-N(6)/adenine(1519)-N(6))-dimethyltransferase RsmA [Rickettsiales bacterium]|jgi:16S rRNA (adenine1518-N6/adenine1519-N6)-dimethyltransferase|nr:16S rRNA (adenine(1518)-N(6)/adenine(1519)-N(6))-dimethyltransferase RsmA [Rickettsiales bacterium]